jgi:PKD repeat protein
MKTIRYSILAATILLFTISSTFSQTIYPWTQDGKIYIKIQDQVANPFPVEQGRVNLNDVSFLQDKIADFGITSMRNPFYTAKDTKLERTFLITFTDIQRIDQLIALLETENVIEYAEKVPIFKMFLTPNDTYYGDLSGILGTVNGNWHLDAISAENAWDISTGNPNIKVAVIDNGIYVAHPDLDSKIVAQIDLADLDNDPTPPTADLTWSHGTHTSGLVAAETNNNQGVASIGNNISLMAVKVGRDLDGALIAGYEGIFWAADNGADVISMSWGSTQYFQTMQNTVNYAYNKGCVLVAAAGNAGNDTIEYPAGLAHVISVASVDEGDGLSSFSCYGPWIDVCAPGGMASGSFLFSVLSTTYSDASFIGAGLYGVSGKYDVMSGTSMSCPIVAGLCGLMLSVDSTLTPEKLEDLLKLSCDNIDAQNSGHLGDLGAGRVNAWHALQAVQDSAVNLVADFYVSNTAVMVNDSINFFDNSLGAPISWNWSFPGGTPATSTDQNPTGIYYAAPGFYPVTLTISDGTTNNTETKTNFILVKSLASSAWIPQSTGFPAMYRGIRNISIVNPQIIWASAYDGSGGGANVLEFTKTSDGGNNWESGLIGIPSTCSVSELFALNTDTAWVATYGNTTGGNAIFRTNDGGQTWTAQASAVYSGTSAFPNTIYFWDANDGVCLGDPNGGYFEIYTTNNGGDTWTRVPQANIPAPLTGEYSYNGGKDYDVVGDVIWYGTNKGNVFKSVDRGLNWTSVATGNPEVTNITFGDADHGIVQYKTYNTGTGEVVLFEMQSTDDGGLTWNDINYTGDIYKSDIDAVPGHPGMYIVTGSSQTLTNCGSSFSLDFGQSWTKIDDSVQYTCVKFHDINTGWAGGFNVDSTTEGIWKWMGLIQDSINIIADFIADSTTINIGGTIDFTDLSLGNVDSWDWDFNGGTPASSSIQNPSGILYSAVGDYTVTLTCSNADTSVAKTKTMYIHVVDPSAAIGEIQQNNLLSVYPNPADENIYLQSNFNLENALLHLYDMTGKRVAEYTISIIAGQAIRIEINQVEAGFYMLELYNGKEIFRNKVCIR